MDLSEDLLNSIYLKQGKTEKAIKLCSNKLLNYINNSCLILITLSNISQEEKNYEKTLFYLDACYRMQNIFKIGSLTPLAYKYAKLYIEIGDKEAAAKWFKTYVEGVISAEYDYQDNPYFEKVELEIKPDEQRIMKKKLLESIINEEEFKVLNGISEYDETIKKVKLGAFKI